VSEARQLKRDRKAYQQQIQSLEQQLAQAAQQTKKKAKEADAQHEALWELKRERLIDEERDQFYADLALGMLTDCLVISFEFHVNSFVITVI
jgi:DNA-directed RNA polymerase subunit M/transcription elongation factor TFIIS